MEIFTLIPEHRYSLAATGIKFHAKDYGSRIAATEAMYKEMGKRGLRIEKVYDDKHYKTYICQDNVRFYINRY